MTDDIPARFGGILKEHIFMVFEVIYPELSCVESFTPKAINPPLVGLLPI